jgi:WD40 repeat protein
LTLFSLSRKKPIKNTETENKIWALKIKDTETFLSGDHDGNIFIWGLFSMIVTQKLNIHESRVKSLDFYSDGILSGSFDGDVFVNFQSGEKKKVTNHSDWVRNVKYLNGKFIASVADDKCLALAEIIVEPSNNGVFCECISIFGIK